MIATSLAELGRQVGLGRSQMSRLAKKSWFPRSAAEGYDVDQVRAALATHHAGRKADPSSAPASARVGISGDDPDILTLMAGDAEPLAIIRAAVRLAARALAQGMVDGTSGARDRDDLKRAIEELRQSEKAHLELAERRGELIPLDVAMAVAGQIAQRLNGILQNVEALLSNQFEIWLGDDAFRSLPTEERGRRIRAWFGEQARELRETEAADIEAMIEQERKDSA